MDMDRETDKIYKKYIYEITILLGCQVRWSITNDIENKIAQWILEEEENNCNKSNSTNRRNEIYLNSLVDKINNTLVNVTSIKASVRSLLRMKEVRRKKLINFAQSIAISTELKVEMKKNLQTDLLIDQKELGYDIPIMPLEHTLNNQMKVLNSINTRKLALAITLRELAIKVNKRKYIFKLDELIKSVQKQILTYDHFYDKSVNKELSTLSMNEGIELGLIYFRENINSELVDLS